MANKNCFTCGYAAEKSTFTDCVVCFKQATTENPYPGWIPKPAKEVAA